MEAKGRGNGAVMKYDKYLNTKTLGRNAGKCVRASTKKKERTRVSDMDGKTNGQNLGLDQKKKITDGTRTPT